MKGCVWWCALVATVTAAAPTWGQTQVATVKPQYLPPAELAQILGVRGEGPRGTLEWRVGEGIHMVEVRRNDAANLLVLAGTPEDVAAAEAMVKAADVAPRQIMVEAKIVEVDRDRLTELGFDWGLISANLRGDFDYRSSYRKSSNSYNGLGSEARQRTTDRIGLFDASADVIANLRALEHAGAATVRDAPRILTLNNRRATVLDGQRVTYITRYSSYTNLFQTDTLDAGLTLSVVPSLGESGYLTLDVRAELTNLSGEISGSPIKDGQIVENTVVVKDGESVMVGGFQRTVVRRTHRRFPLLGRLVPFLFSRETVSQSSRENFVVITPRVVDLTAGVDGRTRGLLRDGEVPEKQ